MSEGENEKDKDAGKASFVGYVREKFKENTVIFIVSSLVTVFGFVQAAVIAHFNNIINSKVIDIISKSIKSNHPDEEDEILRTAMVDFISSRISIDNNLISKSIKDKIDNYNRNKIETISSGSVNIDCNNLSADSSIYLTEESNIAVMMDMTSINTRKQLPRSVDFRINNKFVMSVGENYAFDQLSINSAQLKEYMNMTPLNIAPSGSNIKRKNNIVPLTFRANDECKSGRKFSARIDYIVIIMSPILIDQKT